MKCNIYQYGWITRPPVAVREDGLVFKYEPHTLRWLEWDRTPEQVASVMKLVAKNVQFKQP